MPRVSVVIPALNAEATVGSALRSTLRALPRDAEVVVLDDGSTDATAERVADVDDSRVRLLRRERPSGVAAALTYLMANVDSEVVARMDADDICLPWRFRYQLAHLTTDRPVNFAGLAHNRGRVTLRSPITSPTPVSPAAGRLMLMVRNPFAHPTLVARRAAIDVAGGYRETTAEDYDLWLRLTVLDVPMERLRLPTVLYRHHAGQLSGTSEWKRRALQESHIRSAYREAAGAVLGIPEAEWLEDLWDPQSAPRRPDAMTQFHERIIDRSRYLSRSEQDAILGTLQQFGAGRSA